MRFFLIILIIFSYIGGISSFIAFSVKEAGFSIKVFIILISMIIINILCAKYLYHKATNKKVEWALFGLLANIHAIFIYWLYNLILSNWKRKEQLFK